MTPALFLTLLSVSAAVNASLLSANISEIFKWRLRAHGKPHIIGGKQVAEPIPYQVYLSKQTIASPSEYFCGGSLITPEFILTAAHCTENFHAWYFQQHRVSAHLGSLERKFNPATSFQSIVLDFITPSQRDTERRSHDIALLMIENPAPVNNINIAVVPLRSTPPADGEQCVISGWGTTDITTDEASDKLHSAVVPIVPQQECQKKYRELRPAEVTPDMICAGREEGGVDTCVGDSGGPMVCNGELAGVTSWGWKCGYPGIPGVYSSVAHHRKWIDEAMKFLKYFIRNTTKLE